MICRKCVCLEKSAENKWIFCWVEIADNIEITGDAPFHLNAVYDLELENYILKNYWVNQLENERLLIAAGIDGETVLKIQQHAGDKIFEMMADPDALETLVGLIGKRRANKAVKAYAAYMDAVNDRKLYLLADRYHMSEGEVKAVRKHFEGYYDIPEKNPYSLCAILPFERIDSVCRRYGYEVNNCMRLKAAVLYCIRDACQKSKGMAVSPKELLCGLDQMLNCNRLEVSEKELKAQINALVKEQEIYYEYGYIYEPYRWKVEKETAQLFKTLSESKIKPLKVTDEVLQHVEEKNQFKLHENQKSAIMQVASNGITLIVGGPGTGKSTIIKILLQSMWVIKPEMKAVLMAPTGRAAARMSECTGNPANTIHSVLHLDPSNDLVEGKVVEADLIIIDEVSMIDMFLAWKILKNVKPGSRIVFIGDDNQLPSIREGAFLRELVVVGKRGKIGFAALSRIFRQGYVSRIPTLAEAVNAGATEDYDLTGDVSYVETQSDKALYGEILRAIRKDMEKGLFWKDIITLVPLKQFGPMCTAVLNRKLQDELNPFKGKEYEYTCKGTTFRVGSRVINTENGDKISNGDLGTITGIRDGKVCIDFDSGTYVECGKNDMYHIELAFAITIYKSQGSQFKSVILPLHYSFNKNSCKELYYTAITRAMSGLRLIGDLSVLRKASAKENNYRVSFLALRILTDEKQELQKRKGEETQRAGDMPVQLTIADFMKAVS